MILSFWLTIAHQEKINLGRIYVFDSSQSELRLPLLQVVSSNKYFSVGVQSPTEINAHEGAHCLGDNGFAPTERSVECSDSEKKMSACADQNHAPSLTCVRLEQILHYDCAACHVHIQTGINLNYLLCTREGKTY